MTDNLHSRAQAERDRLLALATRQFPNADAATRSVFAALAQIGGMQAACRNEPPAAGYGSYEELVLARGQLFPWRPRPTHIPKLPARGCYRNASQIAGRHRLTYVEGYAMAMIPVAHAWVVDDDGFVIDATWDDDTPTGFYLGIALDRDKVADFTSRTGYHGVLCNDWQQGNGLLRPGGIDRLLDAAHRAAS